METSSVTTLGTSIITALTSGIKDGATAVADALVTAFKAVFINTTGGLSDIGIVVLTLGGLGLAFGIAKMIGGRASRRIG